MKNKLQVATRVHDLRPHQDNYVAEMQHIEREIYGGKSPDPRLIMGGSPSFQAPGDFIHEYIYINVWKEQKKKKISKMLFYPNLALKTDSSLFIHLDKGIVRILTE